ADGAVFTSGDGITATAVVDDPLGIAEVRFTLGGTEQVLTAEPWSATFSAPPVAVSTPMVLGVEVLDLSARILSDELTVTVQPLQTGVPPVVSLGDCPRDLDLARGGDALTISYVVTDDEAVESVRLFVDGVLTAQNLGLDSPTVSASFPWTVPAGSAPGTVHTLRVESADFGAAVGMAEVRIEVAPASTLVGNHSLGATHAGQVLVLAPGTHTLTEPLALQRLVLLPGATLVGEAGEAFELDVSGQVRLQCGSKLEMTSRGHAGGVGTLADGNAPPGIQPAINKAGASHGGKGRGGSGSPSEPNPIYGSVYEPHQAGAGGAGDSAVKTGGAGGGLVRIDAGSLVIDGKLYNDGQSLSGSHAGAGAGGAVLLRASTLTGSGDITARGGNDYRYGFSAWAGLGGGGRVALHVGSLIDFDPVAQVYVEGGKRIHNNEVVDLDGAPGTVLYRQSGDVHGHLIVDARAGTRPLPATSLPALGGGSVSLLEAAGADLWITGAAAFPGRWLGAWMRLGDASGADLGRYRVVELDVSGRARLEGAATPAATATTYAGEYVFDSTTVRGGATLDVSDRLVGGTIDITESTRLPAVVEAEAVTVRSGATLRALAGRELHLLVSGAVVIEAGGAIDMSSQGYAGGTNAEIPGQAPPGISRAQVHAGASHGGLGRRRSDSGALGEVYGSLFLPHEAGAGGARGDTNHDGAWGGGLITLDAGSVQIDGELRANGGSLTWSTAGAGAGGAVVISTPSLSGSGAIHAQGGDDNRTTWQRWAGVAGGGRVALWVDAFAGFDPVAQVHVQGGSRIESTGITLDASAGTLFVRDATSTHGRLIVDARAAHRPLPATFLPHLGSGAVTATEVQGADAWITGGSAFLGRWLGGRMRLGDASGADLGSFRVLGLDGSGRALLEGAATPAATAAVWSGEYFFDSIELRGGAGLDATDPVHGGQLDFAESATLPPLVLADSMIVRSGAILTVSSGMELELVVGGALTIETGSGVTLSNKGYLRGTNSDIPGHSPPGIARAQIHAGGSHGGLGRDGITAGSVGEVYGSVYRPILAGAGGARGNVNQEGGNGGGFVRVTAGSIVLDGSLAASGYGVANSFAGTGAGGTVRIHAQQLSGAGQILALGGLDHRGSWTRWAGIGGGGRIAIWADSISGFDVQAQAKAYGGHRLNPNSTITDDAAAGTIYVKRATDTWGELILNGFTPSRPVPKTTLPVLAAGTVSATEAAGADLWLQASAPFQA
ncbi:MAG: hypothetical protein MI919_28520, partial [Holophagales bacterium]|nr:hypothetical protein [Holophagales bacterium]